MGLMTNRVVKFIRKGDDSVTYAIVSNVDILKLPSGASTLNNVVWHIVKSAGNTTTAINTDAALQANGLTATVAITYGSTSTVLPTVSFTISDLSRIVTAVTLQVKKGGIVVAAKHIPVVADGTNATSPIFVDLDNDNISIPCAYDGTPIAAVNITSNATLYSGASAITANEWDNVNTNCAATVNSSGVVSVTGISADTAEVEVKARYGTKWYTTRLTLSKIRAGSPGASPVVYSIEPNVNVVQKDADGNISPTTITCEKYKTVGSSARAITTDGYLCYFRIGKDTQTHQYTSAGVEITPDTTAIDFLYYADSMGHNLYDRERIPVVSDGSPGESGQDAISVDVTPSSAVLRDICIFEIKVTATKGCGKMIHGTASAGTNPPYFVCPALGSGTAVKGHNNLRWNSEIRDDGYTFAYVMKYSGGDIDFDLPINVIVYPDGVNPVSIPKVVHIANAPKGDRGPALRGPQMWNDCANGYSFQCGGDNDEYKDVVIYNNSYYSCKKSHTKTADNFPTSPADQNNGYWQLASSVEMVATKILFATYALVKNLGVECIDMKDASGNILFQAKDGEVICKTGTFENVIVSGFVKPKTTVITSANYTDYTVTVEDRTYLNAPSFTGHVVLDASLNSIIANDGFTPYFIVPSDYGDAESIDDYIGSTLRIINNTSYDFGMTGTITDGTTFWFSPTLNAGNEIYMKCILHFNSQKNRRQCGWEILYNNKKKQQTP